MDAPEEERQHPERAGVGRRELMGNLLAAKAARRLAQMWEAPPEKEKRLVREMMG